MGGTRSARPPPAAAPHRFPSAYPSPITTRSTTTPMTPDAAHVERRSSWRDEHLDCICGLANGRGGVLEIGREAGREAIRTTDLLRLADVIPDKVQSVLSIVVNVHVRSDRGRDYLRIDVPSHSERVNPDQPENNQKTARRPPENRRKRPSVTGIRVAFRPHPPASQAESVRQPPRNRRHPRHHPIRRPVPAGQAARSREGRAGRSRQGGPLEGAGRVRL